MTTATRWMATRWMGGLAASAATVGLLLAGGGTAFADSDSGSSTPNSETAVCTQRIPAVLARIDKVTARINGDAGTRGSTEWLQAKAEQARKSGFPTLADLLDTRVKNRPDRLDELSELRSDVENVQKKDCAS